MRFSKQHIKKILVPVLALVLFVLPHVADAATIGVPTDFLSINRGLIDWWTMDGKDSLWSTPTAGTSVDRVSGNSGTFVSMSQSSAIVPGKIGQGYKFNAAGDFMTMGDLSNTDFGTSDFTMGLWIKTPPITNGPTYKTIMDKRNSCNYGNQWMFSLGAGALPATTTAGFNVDETNAGDSFDISGTVNVGDNKWHHILITRSGTLYNFYSDGQFDATGNSPTNISFSNSASLNVGTGVCAGVDGSTAYTGSLDDFRIYNRALSASEVRQLYSLGSSRSGLAPTRSLTSGLVGWWTMDGKDTNWNTNKANDLSGSGNTGTMINLPTSTSPIVGKIGQGLNFNSSIQSYINLGNPSSLDLSGSVSACAWVNLKSWPPTNDSGTIIANVGAGPIFQYFFGLNDQGDLAVTWSPDGATFGGITDNTLTQIPLGKWSHVCFSRNGVSSGAIYYNGSPLSSTFTSVAAPTSAFGPVSIGGMAIGAGVNPLDGVIDDLRVYNRALSAAEIKQVYSLGSAKQNVASPGSTGSNLTGWWTFDGKDIIQNIRDSSGQGNNGNLVGFTSTTTTVGKVGQAMLFNGTNQYVTIVSTPAPGAEFTVNAWIKPTSGNGFVVYRGDKSCCLSYKLFLSGGTASFGVAVGAGGNSDYQANSASTVNTSGRIWSMLTGVFSSSGNLTAVYINGVLDGTPDIAGGTISNSVSTTNIGADNSAANYLTGAIDDVRTFNKALSATEVMKLYKQGK